MSKDKKKTMVVAGLGVLLLTVGAFQFIGKGSGSTPVAETAKQQATAAKTYAAEAEGKPVAKAEETDPQRAMLIAMVKDPLPSRDPFAPIGSPVQQKAPSQPEIKPPVIQQKSVPHQKWAPDFSPGNKPYDPLPGNGQAVNPANNPNVSTAPPLRQPSEFAYRVKGILNGPKPMAVFEDDSGNQRLVPLGGSVDGDSKVVGIEKGKVHIRQRGKDKVVDLSEGQ